jgi:hypothetical protein
LSTSPTAPSPSVQESTFPELIPSFQLTESNGLDTNLYWPNIEDIRDLTPPITWALVTHTTDEQLTQRLLDDHYVQFKINDHLCTVDIEYQLQEGAVRILELTVSVEGSVSNFAMEDYDAEFEKLAIFDTDSDSRMEILLLFDTHGVGGQGTHDLFILKDQGKAVTSTLFSANSRPDAYEMQVTFLENHALTIHNEENTASFPYAIPGNTFDFLYDHQKLYVSTTGQAEGIYDFKIINWNDREHLLVYQSIWAYDHSIHLGDLVSVVDFGTNPYGALQQQIELSAEYKSSIILLGS